MVTIITSPKSKPNQSGKRLQIRGFPEVWAQELTFDDISWYLFDKLCGYGPIDNITVTKSKKDSLIYGVIDMMREEDACRIMNELQDNTLPLPEWDASLSFIRLNANKKNSENWAKQGTSASSQSKPKPLQSIFNTSKMEVHNKYPRLHTYNRLELLIIRDAGNIPQCTLDSQFNIIFREVETMNNQNTDTNPKSSYGNRTK